MEVMSLAASSFATCSLIRFQAGGEILAELVFVAGAMIAFTS
jgi:hypothetical protein